MPSCARFGRERTMDLATNKATKAFRQSTIALLRPFVVLVIWVLNGADAPGTQTAARYQSTRSGCATGGANRTTSAGSDDSVTFSSLLF